MTVLVVRPEPACSELVNLFQAANMDAIGAPFLQFATGKESAKAATMLPTLPPHSVVLAVSPRAVEFTHAALQAAGKPWPQPLHYIAIGEKTAHTWRALANIHALTPARHDSEGVMQLPFWQMARNITVAILRGNGGREFIGDTLALADSKANVCYFEVYQRIWYRDGVTQHKKQWQQNRITSVVVTSGEQLRFMWQDLDNSEKNWIIRCQLFVPSQRIYLQAKSLGFTWICNVNSANNLDLFTAVRLADHTLSR
ncbi:MAG: uroporphyrinogen-III synthase [Vibrionaceae bacterium]